MDFQKLVSQPRSAIFALYNRKENRVYLTLAKNYLKHIATIATDLQDGTFKHRKMQEEKDNLELIVLETLPPYEYETLKMHMHYWYLHCKDLGMKFYTKKCHVIYRANTSIGLDYDGNTVIFVNLVTRRNDKIVVGVFEKMHEAEKYIEDYLETSYIVYPVYATNELTKRYIEHERLRLDKLFQVRM